MKIKDNRALDVTGETAILLGRAFGISAEFWMHLQGDYELALARERIV